MGVRAADSVFQECTYQVVNAATDSTTVYTGPCIFYGAVVTTVLSAHVLPIQDGSTILFNFAASAAVGTLISLPVGVRFDTSIVVDPNDAATGVIVVFYRPLAGFTP